CRRKSRKLEIALCGIVQRDVASARDIARTEGRFARVSLGCATALIVMGARPAANFSGKIRSTYHAPISRADPEAGHRADARQLRRLAALVFFSAGFRERARKDMVVRKPLPLDCV